MNDPLEDESNPGEGSLESLRELLVGEERRELYELRDRIDRKEVTAEEVGRVLPEAVAARSRADDRLSAALTPTIEGAIETSVRRNPRVLTDAIFPVMGPAIRKSISQAMASIVERINKTLEHSMSPKGIRWRLEAMRTGQPFAEIVLRHSLVFRVEQVFLIHRETALLIEHVAEPSVVPADADVISGMLGAIQDFVSDSFAGRDAGVQQVEFGDQVLEVATGPSAVIACLVRGSMPPKTRVRIHEALEGIHAQWGSQLRGFDGDATEFLPSRTTLEELLVEERAREEGKRKSRVGPMVLVTIALALPLLAVLWWVRDSRRAERWSGTLEALRSAPGIIVTRSERDGGSYFLEGLRDPLAEDPAEILARADEVDPDDVEAVWKPYQSLEPTLVLARADIALLPPPTVTLGIADRRLEMSGRASHAWLERARLLVPTLSGVESLDDRVTDEDLEVARVLVEGAADTVVPFTVGSIDLTRDAIAGMSAVIDPLQDAVRRAGAILAIRVAGFATSGEPPAMAAAREATIGEWLRTHTTARVRIELAGPGAEGPALARAVLHASLVER